MPHYLKAFVLISSLLVSACGFHLRGNINLPAGVEPIIITGLQNSGSLAIELRNELMANGITITTAPEEANYQLAISKAASDKRITAVGERARAIEYQLEQTVVFELLNAKGQRVLGPSTIIERRIMPNDPNKVVSTYQEEAILRREMLKNLGAKIARQLRSFDYTTEPPMAEPTAATTSLVQ
ncbi:LPS assembly lipoprotein LptE [Oceanicoccus sp. KOV_DT_Chl]|uniref:LPS-assembly lipoprotein LptE n=1 Tax=Oceanicoccus sp. KOV_DT_Chl TaxID=1904639 RepID=UPI000C7A8E37|nr:LPS assembly lipoprotein LptE [Oceanicoccus sp. KOV_DT_Chl]